MDLAFQILSDTIASPWLYLLVFVVAGFDSLFPVVPSETVLITAAAYAVSGIPNPIGLIAAATVGAVIGDFGAHLVGRGGGGLVQRWTRSPRLRRLFETTEDIFTRRGGSVLIAGRFIPGGRTAATITSGLLRYPRRRFFLFDAVGALAWAVYSTGIGMLGGALFADQPLLGVGLGIGIALLITAVAEFVRRARGRRQSARGTEVMLTHRRTPDSTGTQVDVAP